MQLKPLHKNIAYYNENDPFAAAWLRELIKEEKIAPGVVDERSIEDVTPIELESYDQCHFFAGIGGWSYALRLAGWPDDRPIWTGSCPCQPFSQAGKRKGGVDKRHLWPAFLWHIQQHRPDTILGEQVASRSGLEWWDIVRSDLEATDYATGAFDLCAASVGAPHIRQRLFWVANANRPRQQWQGQTQSTRRGNHSVTAGGSQGCMGNTAQQRSRVPGNVSGLQRKKAEEGQRTTPQRAEPIDTPALANPVSPKRGRVQSIQTTLTGKRPNGSKAQISLENSVQLVTGQKSNGSNALMGNKGQLNPEFALWLMGYPTEWAHCAARVTRSSHKSQRS